MFIRLFSLFLLWILVVAGCTRSAEQQAEVSGKVTFKGKPLPGGRITFISTKGGYTGSGIISPQGEYHIKAPIGEVQISVDNQMLDKNRLNKMLNKDPSKFSSPETRAYLSKTHMKRPQAKSPEGQQPPGEKQEITGTYVPLPSRYANPSTSGLTFTVKPGSQTHDIELSDSPSVGPGS